MLVFQIRLQDSLAVRAHNRSYYKKLRWESVQLKPDGKIPSSPLAGFSWGGGRHKKGSAFQREAAANTRFSRSGVIWGKRGKKKRKKKRKLPSSREGGLRSCCRRSSQLLSGRRAVPGAAAGGAPRPPDPRPPALPARPGAHTGGSTAATSPAVSPAAPGPWQRAAPVAQPAESARPPPSGGTRLGPGG